ncbi:MAG: DMT family transporter [Pseudomonadota bacterium]|nr:DMT family transporter [Pseudomonadota bacterium]
MDPVAEVAASAQRLSVSRLRGAAWAVLALAIFAGWFVVTRLSVTRELRIWDILALRFGVGALVLLPVLVLQRRSLSARRWREGLLLSFLWGVPFVLCVGLGLQLTSAEQASSVTPGLMPVFTGLIAWAFLGQRPGATRLAGYVVIAAGVIGMLGDRWLAGLRPNGGGLLLLLAAAALWAMYTLRIRRADLSAPVAAAFVCLWSAVLYLPFYLGFDVSRLGFAPLREVMWQTLYQGVLMSGVAIFAYNRAVALLGPTTAAAVFGLVPVVATAVAIPVLGEVPTPIDGLAICAIAIGVALAAGLAARSSTAPARLPLAPPA